MVRAVGHVPVGGRGLGFVRERLLGAAGTQAGTRARALKRLLRSLLRVLRSVMRSLRSSCLLRSVMPVAEILRFWKANLRKWRAFCGLDALGLCRLIAVWMRLLRS